MNRPTEARAFVRNTADPEQVKKAGSSVKYREDQEDNDLRTLMSESIGRRVAWRLLSEFGIYKTIFDGHGGRMSYNAGRHDTGLWLLGQIMRVSPDDYLLMQREAAQMDLNIEEPKPTKDSNG